MSKARQVARREESCQECEAITWVAAFGKALRKDVEMDNRIDEYGMTTWECPRCGYDNFIDPIRYA